jgi:hypothetical protein
MGFSLHAATTASVEDSRGREALVRYALRPPIAQERLHILPDNLVRIELKRPFSDGDAEEWLKNQTVAIDLDPLSLLCRLALLNTKTCWTFRRGSSLRLKSLGKSPRLEGRPTTVPRSLCLQARR